MTENNNVGYGKPPKHTQFKKGQCANPKGRGAQKKFLGKEIFRRLLQGKVKYTANGRPEKATRLELLIKKKVALALKGDVPSAVALINLHALFAGANPDNVDWVTIIGGPAAQYENWIEGISEE